MASKFLILIITNNSEHPFLVTVTVSHSSAVFAE